MTGSLPGDRGSQSGDSFEIACRLLLPTGVRRGDSATSSMVSLRGSLARHTLRYLRGDARRAALEHLEWTRWEWKIPSGQGFDRNDQLLILVESDAGGRVLSLPVKPGRQGHRYEPTDPLRKPHLNRLALLQRLEGLSYDFWEAGRTLTAGIPAEWIVPPGDPPADLPARFRSAVACRQLPRIIAELLTDPGLSKRCERSGEPLPAPATFLGDSRFAGPQSLAVGQGAATLVWRTLFETPPLASPGDSWGDRLGQILESFPQD